MERSQGRHMAAPAQPPLTAPVSGGHSGGVTPVPIPNTEVKPSSADGTWDESPWESRTPPDFFQREGLTALSLTFWREFAPVAGRMPTREATSPTIADPCRPHPALLDAPAPEVRVGAQARRAQVVGARRRVQAHRADRVLRAVRVHRADRVRRRGPAPRTVPVLPVVP